VAKGHAFVHAKHENLMSFVMEAKTSQTTSWDAIHSPPWEQ